MNNNINVLVSCEESQAVCKAFRKLGFNAYSNDVVPCTGGHPEWHIKEDGRAVINGGSFRLQTMEYIDIPKWDLIIAHPPCTYLTNCATRHHSVTSTPVNRINARTLSRIEAMRFFMDYIMANADHIAIENPVGVMNSAYRKPDQIIHPYYFANGKDDKENYWTKRTCLWLKGLPLLTYPEPEPFENPYGDETYPSGKRKYWEECISKRADVRSKTFQGIADAMAEQWGNYLLSIKGE